MNKGQKIASDLKYFSSYSKYLTEKGKKENWKESVDRVMQMHKIKFNDLYENNAEFKELIDFTQDTYEKRYFIGSQRALQWAIEPILKHNSRMFNCLVLYADKASFFQETMYWLLSGCGVGFSVQENHVKTMPKLVRRTQGVKTFVISDDIEGWSDSIGVLISSFLENGGTFPEYKGHRIDFDYSLIRPKGAEISGGFKAPGPEGLRQAHLKIEKLLDDYLKNADIPAEFKSILIYDVVMHSSDAVLSGGVRRCLPEGSKVFLKDGIKNIEDVTVGDIVLTPNGYERVANTFIQGEQQTLVLNTQDGSFECTPNHKMAVLDSLDSYVWKRADEIKSGDLLITNTQAIEGQKTYLPKYEYVNPLNSTTCKDIVIPDLDESMAWLLGYMMGNGYVYYNPSRNKTNNSGSDTVSAVMSTKHEEIAEKVQQQLSRFGVTVTRQKRKSENSFMVKATSKQLAEYFYTNFKRPKSEMSIPECIWNGTSSIKKAYVSGYTDADGCLNSKPSNVASSVDLNFLKDVQTLLYSCGISTRLTKNDSTKWSSRKSNWKPIFKLNFLNTRDKVLFIDNNTSLVKKMKMGKISRLGNAYPSDFIKKSSQKFNKSKMGVYSLDNITVDCVQNNGGTIKYNPTKVVSVEVGRNVNTYDIEVENEHQFYCNGYLTHNSATICLFSKTDDDMIKAKTGDWYIKNPQRGRSNNSVVLIKNSTTKEEFSEIMESVKQFGEPGFVWSEHEDILYNPCLTEDSVIETNKGKFSIKNLMEMTKDEIDTVKVLTLNEKTSKLEYNKIKTVFKTAENQKIFKVSFDDNSFVKSTPDHKFYTVNRGWVEAKDLNESDLFYQREFDYANFEESQLNTLESYSTSGKFIPFIAEDENKTIDENNSIEIDLPNVFKKLISIQEYQNSDVFDLVVENNHNFFANGTLVHNCVEIGMVPKYLIETQEDAEEFGANIGEYVTGAQGCNLTEINGALVKTKEEFLNACKASAIMGTLQASYTDFRYVNKISKKIFDKEALLGCSITGWMNNPDILFDEQILKEGVEVIRKYNEIVAKLIGINPSARLTCTKPSGNASVLLGCASGIHGEHAPMYFRNMQFNKTEDIAEFMRIYNPDMVEESVWSSNKTDWVISVPIETNKNAIFKDQLYGVKQLEFVKKAQQWWVETGTNVERCTIPETRHNISNTISVDNWDEVEEYIWENRQHFAGISLLSATGDRDYAQAPFTTVYSTKEIVKMYGDASLYASGLIVDALNSFNNNLWSACDTVLGYGEKLKYTKEEVITEMENKTPEELWTNLESRPKVLKALIKLGEKPDLIDYKEYMDRKLVTNVFKASEKIDWVRRANQFADRFFDGDVKQMTYCLKDVFNNHKWNKIQRNMVVMDWEKYDLRPSYIEVDELGAMACSGVGGCEIPT
jgi:intein/homing endonuclease